MNRLALGVLLGLCWAVAAHAQSQSGGLPTTNQRLTVLEGAVKGLQSTLAAEAAARKAADDALQASLAALQASFNSLQALITNSTMNLQNQINTLATNVQNLSATVQSLNTSVASLEASKTLAVFSHSAGSVNLDIPSPDDPDAFPPQLVLSAFLPAGKFVIYAHADIVRSSSDGASRCFITSGPFIGSDNTSANETLITDTDSNFRVRFVLMGRAETASPSPVDLWCASPRSRAINASITAIRVGALDYNL